MRMKCLFYAIVVTMFLSAGVYAKGMMGGSYSSNMNMNNMDQRFIENMIPHHQDAVDMAKMALQKSKKDEIKKLSNEIIASQTSEIEMMKKWYKVWYNTDVPKIESVKGMGNGGGMMTDTGMMKMDMKELEKASDFDMKFIEMMVVHHKMAVMMSGMIIDSKKNEMRKLARDINSAQSTEIEKMIQWYIKWYGSW